MTVAPSGRAGDHLDLEAALRREIDDLSATLDAIRTGRRPLCDGEEGRRSVKLVEDIYRSAGVGHG